MRLVRDDVAPLVVGHAHHETVAGDAGVVHEDLDRAEAPPRSRRTRGRRSRRRRRRRSLRVRRRRWPRSRTGSPWRRLRRRSSRTRPGCPRSASATAIARPMPRDAPVTNAVRTGRHACPHRSSALPHVRPAPNPDSEDEVAVGWRRPSSAASARTSGIEAALVLPYRSMLTSVRSGGIPRRPAADLDDADVRLVGREPGRRRRSSTPARASVVFADSTTMRTARRNTSWPGHAEVVLAVGDASRRMRDGGSHPRGSRAARWPNRRSRGPMRATRAVVGRRARAPSRRRRRRRGCRCRGRRGSVTRESVSAPMTSTWSRLPAVSIDAPTTSS